MKVTGLDYLKGKGSYILTLQNFGKSPALNLETPYLIFANNYDGVPGAQSASCDTRIYDNDPQGEWGRVLWPEQVKEVASFAPLREPIKAPTPNAIYVAGCITYHDIFGARHWAKFCYYTDSPEIPDQDFRACWQYNRTDDQVETHQ
jgi:hypothetical protein